MPRTIECHECGLFLQLDDAPAGMIANCPRCGHVVRRFAVDPLGRCLAWSMTGLVLLLIANLMPFMSMKLEARIQDTNLLGGVVSLYADGLWQLAVLVLATTLLAPALKLGGTTYLLIALRMRNPPRYLPRLLRMVELLKPWAMVEVFLLGAFVAYVKLVDMASVELGLGLYALAGLMIVIAASNASLDTDLAWLVMERRGLVRRAPRLVRHPVIACEVCSAVYDAKAAGGNPACRRCGSRLHQRKPDSINRTWALVITAFILYIPANIFPVMTVISFGRGAPDTILSGVVHLVEAGMWPLGLLVFFASVAVPLLKMVGVVVLLISIQRGWRARLRERTVLYRIIEGVGRWSMIDIYMLAILVSLVRLDALATIEPGIGAIAFAAVVVITMLAAMSFDPRLMWDAAGENREPILKH